MTLAWAFEDEGGPAADAILARLTNEFCLVPLLWPLEVTNALLVAERRGRLTESESHRFMGLLSALLIEVDDETPRRAFAEVLSLARRHDLSSYDAAYLELAMRSALPLASFDERLRTAAKKSGVELLG